VDRSPVRTASAISKVVSKAGSNMNRSLGPTSRIRIPTSGVVSRIKIPTTKVVSLARSLDKAAGSRTVGRFAGTNSFVGLQIACVVVWIVVNTRSVIGLTPFDPFPFPLLGMVLALEAVLLTSFVLIRQNRMSEIATRRGHLDLQISLLAEKEATKVIQLLQRMSKQLGIEDAVTDKEARELSKDTEVEDVARDLRENLEGRAEH
jgi:uncharacterized membrane protein